MMSPCIGICDVEAQKQVCRGCLRTLKEIAEWTTMPDDERQDIMQRVVIQLFEQKEE